MKKVVKKTKPLWFVWHVEYPDEGSYLVAARTKKLAIAVVHAFDDDVPLEDRSELDACRATAEQIKTWKAS